MFISRLIADMIHWHFDKLIVNCCNPLGTSDITIFNVDIVFNVVSHIAFPHREKGQQFCKKNSVIKYSMSEFLCIFGSCKVSVGIVVDHIM